MADQAVVNKFSDTKDQKSFALSLLKYVSIECLVQKLTIGINAEDIEAVLQSKLVNVKLKLKNIIKSF